MKIEKFNHDICDITQIKILGNRYFEVRDKNGKIIDEFACADLSDSLLKECNITREECEEWARNNYVRFLKEDNITRERKL